MPRAGKTQIPRVLFEDTHVLVVDKPAGLLSQGDRSGAPSLVDWARKHVGRPYVGLVHRLDRNTSGVMVLAKRTKSARRLTEALRAGEMHRTYLAWLEGSLRREAEWRHTLSKDRRTNTTRVLESSASHAHNAVLHARPVRRTELGGQSATLAEITLATGKSHQIRVQAAHEGHPLVGDTKYGTSTQRLCARVALHSWRLVFPHPKTGETLEFVAPLPSELELDRPRRGARSPRTRR